MLKQKRFYLSISILVGVLCSLVGYLVHRWAFYLIIVSVLQIANPPGKPSYLDRLPQELSQAFTKSNIFKPTETAVCSLDEQILYGYPNGVDTQICSTRHALSLSQMHFKVSNVSQVILTVKYDVWAMAPLMILSFVFGLFVSFVFIKEMAAIVRKNQENENAKNLNQLAIQVAHDIRSPLGALHVASQILKVGDTEASKKLIFGATNRIREIAEDLLTGSGHVAENKEFFKVVAAIEEIVEEKNLLNKEIKIIISHLSDFTLNASKSYFQRALSNFINNSIEAKRPGVPLEVLINVVDNKISISDNGVGISKENLENLMAGKGRSTKSQGYGIGFAGSIRLLKEMGFKITSQSTIGQGTHIIMDYKSKSLKI